MAHQQSDIQGSLEVRDAATERGLGDIQPRCRSLEAARQSDLGKVANLPYIHGPAPRFVVSTSLVAKKSVCRLPAASLASTQLPAKKHRHPRGISGGRMNGSLSADLPMSQAALVSEARLASQARLVNQARLGRA
jgi:hypothetical protein